MNKLVFIVLFLFLLPFVSADIFQLNLSCESSHCIPGRLTDWNFTMRYNGPDKVELLGYRIQDAITKLDIITYEQDTPFQVTPLTPAQYSVQELLPAPNQNSTLVLNICTITEPPLEAWGTIGRKREYCYRDWNISIEITECLLNSDCPQVEQCINQSCSGFLCGDCQYASGHSCVDYGCCTDDMCQGDELCIQNTCEQIACGEGEYIINRTCTSTACAEDQAIINFACVTLECGDDEFMVNHRCEKLKCKDTEYAHAQSCHPLNCTDEEGHLNHSCVALDCLGTEAIVEHTCEELKCNIFQIGEEHECRLNSNLFLTFFLFLIILFLLWLDRRKLFYLKGKQRVDRLMRVAEKRKTIKK